MYEWLNLALRWFHVVVAIYWVGQTYLFAWLDGRFSELEEAAGDRSDDAVWMVHSGGFYRVLKRTRPDPLPSRLHWTRWEALLTFLSGFGLLVVVYYMGGLMLPAGARISLSTAVGISLGSLVLGWVLYDALWISPIGRRELVAITLSFLLLALFAWGLTLVLSSRASFFHVGALLGTIMTANVWIRILPVQRRMIAAIDSGSDLDPRLSARAKQRSKHNGFLAIPVVLIMLSNHFPTTTYGHGSSWLMLAGFVLVGWAVRAALKWLEG